MSKDKEKDTAAEAKASAASSNKEEKSKKEKNAKAAKGQKKQKKDENKDWLEDELKDVELDSDDDTDGLMKKAAERIESLQADVREWNDKYIRLHAEWDTYRRRTSEQREQEKITATEGIVTDMLPVLDDFERSINYAKENGEDGLLSGVEAVYAKLVSVLEKSGVEVLDPKQDEEFDALQHQAVATVENSDVYDESIAGVMQKGYKMGKKVIRPAMVSVTTGGAKRPKTEEEQDS